MDSAHLLQDNMEQRKAIETVGGDSLLIGTMWEHGDQNETLDLPTNADDWIQSLFDQLPMPMDMDTAWSAAVAMPTVAETPPLAVGPPMPTLPLMPTTLPEPVAPSTLPSQTVAPTSATSPTSTPIKMKRPRKRDTVFVNETWKDVYEKSATKKGQTAQDKSSPSSISSGSPEDSAWGDEPLKLMTSKQRRQHRNKVSAKNFRERRKEYIEQLETKVEQQASDLTRLRAEVTRLEEINDTQRKELDHWRQTAAVPYSTPRHDASPPTTLSSSWSSGASSNDPTSPESVQVVDSRPERLFDFDLFDMNMNIATALLPPLHLDLSGKTATFHVVPAPSIQTYPLLTAALMSIVVQHTMQLYPPPPLSSGTALGKEIYLDLPHMATSVRKPSIHSDKHDRPSSLYAMSVAESGTTVFEMDDMSAMDGATEATTGAEEGEDWISDEEIKDLLMSKYFVHYAFMRLRGQSPESIVHACRDCLRKRREKARSLKASFAAHHLRCVTAFASVAAAAVRQPKQAHLILQNHSCQSKLSMIPFRSLKCKKMVQ